MSSFRVETAQWPLVCTTKVTCAALYRTLGSNPVRKPAFRTKFLKVIKHFQTCSPEDLGMEKLVLLCIGNPFRVRNSQLKDGESARRFIKFLCRLLASRRWPFTSLPWCFLLAFSSAILCSTNSSPAWPIHPFLRNCNWTVFFMKALMYPAWHVIIIIIIIKTIQWKYLKTKQTWTHWACRSR